MSISRILKHLSYPDWRVRRAFPEACRNVIAQAIHASEQTHSGEIHLAIEGALDGLSLWKDKTARQRAIEVFSQLRVWDTEHNNGVLIYVLLADRAVEIVADRGIHARAGMHTWNAICQQMQAAFARAEFQTGVVRGIEALSHSMREHYPRRVEEHNGFSNTTVNTRG